MGRKRRLGFSVYYLLHGEDVVYVGCTSDPGGRRRRHRTKWGHDLELKVQCVVETQEEGERVERQLIAIQRARGATLRNSAGAQVGSQPGGTYPEWMGKTRADLLGPQDAETRKIERKRVRRLIDGTRDTVRFAEK